MAFSIHFGNYYGRVNDLSKNVVFSITKSCEPYDEVDNMRPAVILAYDSSIELCNMANYNGKIYFIESISRDVGNRMIVRMHIDVLSTYRNAIINSSGICARGALPDGGNAWIPDSERPMKSYHEIIHHTFGEALTWSTDEMVLITAG